MHSGMYLHTANLNVFYSDPATNGVFDFAVHTQNEGRRVQLLWRV